MQQIGEPEITAWFGLRNGTDNTYKFGAIFFGLVRVFQEFSDSLDIDSSIFQNFVVKNNLSAFFCHRFFAISELKKGDTGPA